MLRRLQAGLLMLAVMLGAARLSAHDEFTFTGSVVRMDAAKGILTFSARENGKDLTLKIKFTAKSIVERDRKRVPRATLKPGMPIVVHALGCDYEDMDVVKIQITSAATSH